MSAPPVPCTLDYDATVRLLRRLHDALDAELDVTELHAAVRSALDEFERTVGAGPAE